MFAKRFYFGVLAAAVLLILVLGITGGVLAARSDTGGEVSGKVKVVGLRNSANVVVYLEPSEKRDLQPPAEHAVMDQVDLAFVPHVLPILKGTKVDFPNSDKIRHNVYSPACCSTKTFNLGTYAVGESKSVEFDETGLVSLRCNVHSEMSGFALVLDTPYFTTTDRRGRFTIGNVPPGTYTLKTWHEKMKPISEQLKVDSATAVKVNLRLKDRKPKSSLK